MLGAACDGGCMFLDPIIATYGIAAVIGAAISMFLAGFTKGSVGFALPMIAISGVGSVLSAELAIVSILLPSLVTNLWQAFRQGFAAARDSLWAFRWLFGTLLVVIFSSAQLVLLLSDRLLFMVLGVGVTGFALLQLSGFRLSLSRRSRNIEIGVGTVAGFFGGLAGVWGPPILIYLTSLSTPKTEQVRVLGIGFLCGTIMLTAAHIISGLLNASTAPLSALMVVPAVIGMTLGLMLQDRLDQDRFRKLTLAVLVLAGLNLLRRGLWY